MPVKPILTRVFRLVMIISAHGFTGKALGAILETPTNLDELKLKA